MSSSDDDRAVRRPGRGAGVNGRARPVALESGARDMSASDSDMANGHNNEEADDDADLFGSDSDLEKTTCVHIQSFFFIARSSLREL